MKLEHLHLHLQCYDCVFQSYTNPTTGGEFKHVIYKNAVGKKVTIINQECLLPEYIDLICSWLEVPVPDMVLTVLGKK